VAQTAVADRWDADEVGAAEPHVVGQTRIPRTGFERAFSTVDCFTAAFMITIDEPTSP
jgi:hypothetical protein